MLRDNTNPVSYSYQRGIDSITVELKNNIDDFRFSEVEISYEVYITDLNGNKVINKNNEEVPIQKGKLTNKEIEKDVITFENLASGNYVVSAKSVSPYEKTIQANFNLTNKDEEIIYQVSDSVNSPVLQLTIITKDYSGDITINYPKGVIPDNTDSKFPTDFTDSQFTVKFNANSEYTFQFFKNDPTKVYTKSDFIK